MSTPKEVRVPVSERSEGRRSTVEVYTGSYLHRQQHKPLRYTSPLTDPLSASGRCTSCTRHVDRTLLLEPVAIAPVSQNAVRLPPRTRHPLQATQLVPLDSRDTAGWSSVPACCDSLTAGLIVSCLVSWVEAIGCLGSRQLVAGQTFHDLRSW